MQHAFLTLTAILTLSLLVEACAVERPSWRSDRGAIGGAIRDPLTHELID